MTRLLLLSSLLLFLLTIVFSNVELELFLPEAVITETALFLFFANVIFKIINQKI